MSPHQATAHRAMIMQVDIGAMSLEIISSNILKLMTRLNVKSMRDKNGDILKLIIHKLETDSS